MVQAFAERATHMACSGSQALQRFFALDLIPEHSDEDTRVSQIGRDFHVSDCCQPDAGILYFALQDLA